MSSGTTAVVIVVVIVIIALLATGALTARRRRLRQRFGPEYDRAVTEQSSKLRAEAELTDRQRRVRKLDIKPLSEAARRRYSGDWSVIQEQFVDSPQSAVKDAYDLVIAVMTDRGYPTEDTDQAIADLSVEHAETVGHFRAAQQITSSAAAGDAATEDLRQALIHYRALFSDLLGEPAQVSSQVRQTDHADLVDGTPGQDLPEKFPAATTEVNT
jgi:FtsZ-interacting cell division protein ZipA